MLRLPFTIHHFPLTTALVLLTLQECRLPELMVRNKGCFISSYLG